MINLSNSNINSNPYLLADLALKTRVSALEAVDSGTRIDLIEDRVTALESTSNVKFYGAVGDGIVDDTVSIQACITANTQRIYFPMGTYRITGELVINNKLNFQIESQNAILMQDHANVNLYCLKITNCRNPVFSGRITLQSNRNPGDMVANIITVGCGKGIYIFQCRCGGFNNINILGPFLIGMDLYNQDLTHEKQNLQGLVVTNCNIGINMFGEYYTIVDGTINYNRTGVQILGGNNCVQSSGLTFNRIGIYVLGNSGNSDHGKITSCTINHNRSCGIFIKNTLRSYHVTGCSIWGNVDYTFNQPLISGTEILAATTSYFNIYLENVENVNICGNDIAGNIVNLGLNGYVSCNITSNSFLAVDLPQPAGRDSRHIVEYGGAHNTAGRNSQNVISGNTFYGALSDSPISGLRIKFFDNAGASTLDDSTICVNNNRGTTGSHFLNLSVTGGSATEVLFDPNFESLVLNVTNNSIVKLHHSWGGSSFSVNIIGVTAAETKYIELKNASTYSAGELPIIMPTASSNIAYNSTTKRYTFSANGTYNFTTIGPNVNNWLIDRN
jgi:hypothetical protein